MKLDPVATPDILGVDIQHLQRLTHRLRSVKLEITKLAYPCFRKILKLSPCRIARIENEVTAFVTRLALVDGLDKQRDVQTILVGIHEKVSRFVIRLYMGALNIDRLAVDD